MRCLPLLRIRGERPLPFVVCWCAIFIGLTGYLSYLVTLPPCVPEAGVAEVVPEPSIDDATYDAIKPRMPDFLVYDLLRGKGTEIDRPDWQPRTLRDVPGYADDHFEEYKVNWRIWRASGDPDKWIAVGIVWNGRHSHVPFVAGKRKSGF